MYLNPFNDMPLPMSTAPYREHYHCYPMTSCFNPNPRTASTAKEGGKIVLPPSALEHLTQLNIDFPMFFKLSFGERQMHCGVLEFTAPENCCFLPDWMCRYLDIELTGNQLITVEYVNLPIATFVRFQPENSDFYEIYDHKAVLERALRSFACLTQGEPICIHYNNTEYWLNILKTEPNYSVSILECDMSVDFAEPVITSASYKKSNQSNSVDDQTSAINGGGLLSSSTVESHQLVDSQLAVSDGRLKVFSGQGRRLDGKITAPLNALNCTSNSSRASSTSMARSPRKIGIPDYSFKPNKLNFLRRQSKEEASSSPCSDSMTDATASNKSTSNDDMQKELASRIQSNGSTTSQSNATYRVQPFSGTGRTLRK